MQLIQLSETLMNRSVRLTALVLKVKLAIKFCFIYRLWPQTHTGLFISSVVYLLFFSYQILSLSNSQMKYMVG